MSGQPVSLGSGTPLCQPPCPARGFLAPAGRLGVPMLQTNGLGAHQGIPLCPPMRKEEPGEAWGQPSQVSPQGCAAPAGLPTFISAMALCQVPGTSHSCHHGLQGHCPTATQCGHMSIPVTWSLVCHHPVVSRVGTGSRG